MSIFDKPSLRERKFRFQGRVGQRVSSSWQTGKMSKEQEWRNVFNCGLIRGRQVEMVCGKRSNHKRENHPNEHNHYFVYWCVLIGDERIIKRVPEGISRNNGKICCQQGNTTQEVDESRVCAMPDALCTYPRTVMVHFENTSSTN